ncbi:hypothetical protein FA13DRAFT_1714750 [Coprinellus micaceus]|uniref:Uncharacterized protein n=1 Tax=Coprinellus micaceus TaxID=71717 RepID=A0A4Y7SSM9_COPMI|nr:hypothetical protein FA13DRAFT_1714750 [Coprinellus micaceus]
MRCSCIQASPRLPEALVCLTLPSSAAIARHTSTPPLKLSIKDCQTPRPPRLTKTAMQFPGGRARWYGIPTFQNPSRRGRSVPRASSQVPTGLGVLVDVWNTPMDGMRLGGRRKIARAPLFSPRPSTKLRDFEASRWDAAYARLSALASSGLVVSGRSGQPAGPGKPALLGFHSRTRSRREDADDSYLILRLRELGQSIGIQPDDIFRTRAQRTYANFEGCTALVSSVDGTLGPVRRFSLSGGEGANPRPSTCRHYVGEGAYIPICPSSRLPDEVRGERGTPRSKLQAFAIDPHLLSNPLHRPSSIHQGPLKAASCGGSGVFLRASEVDRRGGFRLVGRGCNLPGGGARGWEQG